jgi:hypothetical protein
MGYNENFCKTPSTRGTSYSRGGCDEPQPTEGRPNWSHRLHRRDLGFSPSWGHSPFYDCAVEDSDEPRIQQQQPETTQPPHSTSHKRKCGF